MSIIPVYLDSYIVIIHRIGPFGGVDLYITINYKIMSFGERPCHEFC